MAPTSPESAAYRYERKYFTEDFSGRDLEMFIRLHPAHFHSLFWPRRIFSIYFDTPNLDYYWQNVIGHADRKKVRVRWYEPAMDQPPQLEIKLRNANVMRKESGSLPKWKPGDNLTKLIKEVQFLLQTQLPESEVLQPVMINSYRRSYFAQDSLGMRLTVDTDLEFAHPADWQQGRITQRLAATILECKYNVTDDKNLADVTKGLPLQLTKSSKYVMGIQLCVPSIESY